MKLREIKIRGYKSIDKLDFPVRKYGEGNNESYTTILIGKNEAGKSNVLDAIATPGHKETVYFHKIQNRQKNQIEYLYFLILAPKTPTTIEALLSKQLQYLTSLLMK